jgi:large subunit ribosomal protein L25
MAEISITATKRAVTGKPVNKLRKNGRIPAVVYGHNIKPESLEISANDFLKVFRQAGESTIIDLTMEGKATPVLIQDVQNHYLTEQPIHVDFFAVNMSETLKATVPLHFEGESFAVKSLGGILARNLSEVEVECLPADLPKEIVIDISVLKTFEDSVRVADLKVSEKVKINENPDEVIVAVTPPRSEEEMKALDEKPVEVDVTAVEGVVKPTDTPAAEGDVPAAEEKAVKKE